MPRRLHVCPTPNCGALTRARYCPAHTVGTSERGYGPAHGRARAAWVAVVAAGEVTCRRCGQLIPPGAAWDLGHHDPSSPAPTGPEHRQCNRATAGRRHRDDPD